VALLGVTLLLRMLADGDDRLAWLAWLSPFGLTARTLPYAGNHPGPLVVLAAVPLLLTVATLAAARARDVGGGLVTVRVRRRPHTRLLRSPSAFALRRGLRPTTGWAIGLSTYLLLIGVLTRTILDFLNENPRFADLAARAGYPLGTAEGLAATMFGLLVIPAGLYAATRIAAFAADENTRRLTGLFALPLTRTRLAGAEILVTALNTVALLVVAGFALAAGSPLDTGPALAGALNVAPVAALALAAAMLALGWLPRAVAAVGAIPVAGGFLLQVVASSVDAPAWVRNLSPFAHLAAVPDTPPDWAATAAMTGVAVLVAAAGLAGFARRDLTT
jgi:ABC-2 type transport system permease protein